MYCSPRSTQNSAGGEQEDTETLYAESPTTLLQEFTKIKKKKPFLVAKVK